MDEKRTRLFKHSRLVSGIFANELQLYDNQYMKYNDFNANSIKHSKALLSILRDGGGFIYISMMGRSK